MSYPNTPGYKENDTSKEAAIKIAPHAKTLKEKCLLVLLQQSLTRDEVAEYLKISILSVRPRISELLTEKKVKATGQKRMNASGHRAHVYKAIKEEKAEQQEMFKRAA